MKRLLTGDIFDQIDTIDIIQDRLLDSVIVLDKESKNLMELLQKCQEEVSALSTLRERVETTTLHLNDTRQIVQTESQSIDVEISDLSHRINKLTDEIEKLKQGLETQRIQSPESPPTTQDFL